jgi:hypothetical protein
MEDEVGQLHAATTTQVLKTLKGLPRHLDLVVLNGCESAADTHSVAQAQWKAGLPGCGRA